MFLYCGSTTEGWQNSVSSLYVRYSIRKMTDKEIWDPWSVNMDRKGHVHTKYTWMFFCMAGFVCPDGPHSGFGLTQYTCHTLSASDSPVAPRWYISSSIPFSLSDFCHNAPYSPALPGFDSAPPVQPVCFLVLLWLFEIPLGVSASGSLVFLV